MAALQRLKAYGLWSAKSYVQPCRTARQEILQVTLNDLPPPPLTDLTILFKAARQLQMDIVPEAGMHYYWDLTMLIDGHTTIEHCIPMAPLFNDVVCSVVKKSHSCNLNMSHIDYPLCPEWNRLHSHLGCQFRWFVG